MAVLVDVEIAAEEFDLGRITAGDDDIHVFIDRVVPLTAAVMPFFWAEGTDFDAFEQRVREEHIVESLEAVERFDRQVLYKVRWSEDVYGFTSVLAESGATVLEARGNTPWQFRLRFDSHAGLRELRTRCRAADIEYTIRSISTATGPTQGATQFQLTAGQHEALVAAVEAGYFEVPRETTLSDLAAEFDVSPQALSQRLRRATNEVLRDVLSS